MNHSKTTSIISTFLLGNFLLDTALANAKSLLITRSEVENNNTSNHADRNVLNYDYDIVIQNNGDLREFACAAINFIEGEGLNFSTKPIEINLFGEIN